MDQTTPVMSGRLEEFRLEDVLQAIGSHPQCTAVELRAAGGDLRGTIWIERGRVLGAERGRQHGRDAFYELFDAVAGDVFVVSRLREAVSRPEPLGSVTSLLLARGSQVTTLPAPTRLPTDDGNWDESTVARPMRRDAVVVAITSPRGGVGRSTISQHLARALARAGHRVILIDADGGSELAGAPTLDDLLGNVDAIDGALYDLAPGLRLLPVAPGAADVGSGWRALLVRIRSRADVVLVDCPVGIDGAAAELIAACSHVIGVVRSDRAASASARALELHIDGLAADPRPHLAGIIVNLFDGRSAPSVDAFGQIAAHGVPMFETTIPRADALAEDIAEQADALAWLFDALAAEVSARSGLDERARAAAATASLCWLPR